MIGVTLRRGAVLLAGSALLATTIVGRGGLSLVAGDLVPAAEAQAACARPSMGTEDAILSAAEGFFIESDSLDVFGYARLQRVEGNWARVVVVPRIQTDHALVFLRRDP